VLWTHAHADHCHGIDDMRQVFHDRGTTVPGYARAETLALLKTRFDYVFHGRQGYPPTMEAHVLPDALSIGDVAVRCVDQPHGAIFSTGFLFDHDGKTIGYATDFSEITGDMIALYQGCDVWIADALRVRPHPTHAHLAQTLEAVAAIAPKRTILTHMDHSMDYRALAASLPPGVEPGYDGLVVELL
jgi:phosphoribosyl 1,2-cyclic phosphate phosphodiesterase